ncbi:MULTISPECIES: TIGR02452 family protein [Fusobacterium]|uniref:TIGR02452 family protein n=2 Tax=Fusobacterium TaxID=848 RepID=A0A7G9GXN7_9FUSO|nr:MULTISPECIES: TIGR02452 family protein [Fusobacterium]QNM15569.1 TIGR02452 family protein [Fusobacterium hominis]
MSRIDLVEVFNDTLYKIYSNAKLMEYVINSSNNQEVFLEDDILENIGQNRYNVECQIVVSQKKTLEAAMEYKEEVCVLNFASSYNPGGGVLLGSNAQEESICRCSTLYCNLIQNNILEKFYLRHRKEKNNFLNTDDLIYTPNVVVFKDDSTYEEYKNIWKMINVISCAAPDLSNASINVSEEQLSYIYKKRIKRILEVARLKKQKNIILGAFGCGVFSNSPYLVAKSMFEVIREYYYDFKKIEIAIYDPTSMKINYNTFKEMAKEYC